MEKDNNVDPEALVTATSNSFTKLFKKKPLERKPIERKASRDDLSIPSPKLATRPRRRSRSFFNPEEIKKILEIAQLSEEGVSDMAGKKLEKTTNAKKSETKLDSADINARKDFHYKDYELFVKNLVANVAKEDAPPHHLKLEKKLITDNVLRAPEEEIYAEIEKLNATKHKSSIPSSTTKKNISLEERSSKAKSEVDIQPFLWQPSEYLEKTFNYPSLKNKDVKYIDYKLSDGKEAIDLNRKCFEIESEQIKQEIDSLDFTIKQEILSAKSIDDFEKNPRETKHKILFIKQLINRKEGELLENQNTIVSYYKDKKTQTEIDALINKDAVLRKDLALLDVKLQEQKLKAAEESYLAKLTSNEHKKQFHLYFELNKLKSKRANLLFNKKNIEETISSNNEYSDKNKHLIGDEKIKKNIETKTNNNKVLEKKIASFTTKIEDVKKQIQLKEQEIKAYENTNKLASLKNDAVKKQFSLYFHLITIEQNYADLIGKKTEKVAREAVELERIMKLDKIREYEGKLLKPLINDSIKKIRGDEVCFITKTDSEYKLVTTYNIPIKGNRIIFNAQSLMLPYTIIHKKIAINMISWASLFLPNLIHFKIYGDKAEKTGGETSPKIKTSNIKLNNEQLSQKEVTNKTEQYNRIAKKIPKEFKHKMGAIPDFSQNFLGPKTAEDYTVPSKYFRYIDGKMFEYHEDKVAELEKEYQEFFVSLKADLRDWEAYRNHSRELTINFEKIYKLSNLSDKEINELKHISSKRSDNYEQAQNVLFQTKIVKRGNDVAEKETVKNAIDELSKILAQISVVEGKIKDYKILDEEISADGAVINENKALQEERKKNLLIELKEIESSFINIKNDIEKDVENIEYQYPWIEFSYLQSQIIDAQSAWEAGINNFKAAIETFEQSVNEAELLKLNRATLEAKKHNFEKSKADFIRNNKLTIQKFNETLETTLNGAENKYNTDENKVSEFDTKLSQLNLHKINKEDKEYIEAFNEKLPQFKQEIIHIKQNITDSRSKIDNINPNFNKILNAWDACEKFANQLANWQKWIEQAAQEDRDYLSPYATDKLANLPFVELTNVINNFDISKRINAGIAYKKYGAIIIPAVKRGTIDEAGSGVNQIKQLYEAIYNQYQAWNAIGSGPRPLVDNLRELCLAMATPVAGHEPIAPDKLTEDNLILAKTAKAQITRLKTGNEFENCVREKFKRHQQQAAKLQALVDGKFEENKDNFIEQYPLGATKLAEKTDAAIVESVEKFFADQDNALGFETELAADTKLSFAADRKLHRVTNTTNTTEYDINNVVVQVEQIETELLRLTQLALSNDIESASRAGKSLHLLSKEASETDVTKKPVATLQQKLVTIKDAVQQQDKIIREHQYIVKVVAELKNRHVAWKSYVEERSHGDDKDSSKAVKGSVAWLKQESKKFSDKANDINVSRQGLIEVIEKLNSLEKTVLEANLELNTSQKYQRKLAVALLKTTANTVTAVKELLNSKGDNYTSYVTEIESLDFASLQTTLNHDIEYLESHQLIKPLLQQLEQKIKAEFDLIEKWITGSAKQRETNFKEYFEDSQQKIDHHNIKHTYSDENRNHEKQWKQDKILNGQFAYGLPEKNITKNIDEIETLLKELDAQIKTFEAFEIIKDDGTKDSDIESAITQLTEKKNTLSAALAHEKQRINGGLEFSVDNAINEIALNYYQVGLGILDNFTKTQLKKISDKFVADWQLDKQGVEQTKTPAADLVTKLSAFYEDRDTKLKTGRYKCDDATKKYAFSEQAFTFDTAQTAINEYAQQLVLLKSNAAISDVTVEADKIPELANAFSEDVDKQQQQADIIKTAIKTAADAIKQAEFPAEILKLLQTRLDQYQAYISAADNGSTNHTYTLHGVTEAYNAASKEIDEAKTEDAVTNTENNFIKHKNTSATTAFSHDLITGARSEVRTELNDLLTTLTELTTKFPDEATGINDLIKKLGEQSADNSHGKHDGTVLEQLSYQIYTIEHYELELKQLAEQKRNELAAAQKEAERNAAETEINSLHQDIKFAAKNFAEYVNLSGQRVEEFKATYAHEKLLNWTEEQLRQGPKEVSQEGSLLKAKQDEKGAAFGVVDSSEQYNRETAKIKLGEFEKSVEKLEQKITDYKSKYGTEPSVNDLPKTSLQDAIQHYRDQKTEWFTAIEEHLKVIGEFSVDFSQYLAVWQQIHDAENEANAINQWLAETEPMRRDKFAQKEHSFNDTSEIVTVNYAKLQSIINDDNDEQNWKKQQLIEHQFATKTFTWKKPLASKPETVEHSYASAVRRLDEITQEINTALKNIGISDLDTAIQPIAEAFKTYKDVAADVENAVKTAEEQAKINCHIQFMLHQAWFNRLNAGIKQFETYQTKSNTHQTNFNDKWTQAAATKIANAPEGGQAFITSLTAFYEAQDKALHDPVDYLAKASDNYLSGETGYTREVGIAQLKLHQESLKKINSINEYKDQDGALADANAVKELKESITSQDEKINAIIKSVTADEAAIVANDYSDALWQALATRIEKYAAYIQAAEQGSDTDYTLTGLQAKRDTAIKQIETASAETDVDAANHKIAQAKYDFINARDASKNHIFKVDTVQGTREQVFAEMQQLHKLLTDLKLPATLEKNSTINTKFESHKKQFLTRLGTIPTSVEQADPSKSDSGLVVNLAHQIHQVNQLSVDANSLVQRASVLRNLAEQYWQPYVTESATRVKNLQAQFTDAQLVKWSEAEIADVYLRKSPNKLSTAQDQELTASFTVGTSELIGRRLVIDENNPVTGKGKLNDYRQAVEKLLQEINEQLSNADKNLIALSETDKQQLLENQTKLQALFNTQIPAWQIAIAKDLSDIRHVNGEFEKYYELWQTCNDIKGEADAIIEWSSASDKIRETGFNTQVQEWQKLPYNELTALHITLGKTEKAQEPYKWKQQKLINAQIETADVQWNSKPLAYSYEPADKEHSAQKRLNELTVQVADILKDPNNHLDITDSASSALVKALKTLQETDLPKKQGTLKQHITQAKDTYVVNAAISDILVKRHQAELEVWNKFTANEGKLSAHVKEFKNKYSTVNKSDSPDKLLASIKSDSPDKLLASIKTFRDDQQHAVCNTALEFAGSETWFTAQKQVVLNGAYSSTEATLKATADSASALYQLDESSKLLEKLKDQTAWRDNDSDIKQLSIDKKDLTQLINEVQNNHTENEEYKARVKTGINSIVTHPYVSQLAIYMNAFLNAIDIYNKEYSDGSTAVENSLQWTIAQKQAYCTQLATTSNDKLAELKQQFDGLRDTAIKAGLPVPEALKKYFAENVTRQAIIALLTQMQTTINELNSDTSTLQATEKELLSKWQTKVTTQIETIKNHIKEIQALSIDSELQVEINKRTNNSLDERQKQIELKLRQFDDLVEKSLKKLQPFENKYSDVTQFQALSLEALQQAVEEFNQDKNAQQEPIDRDDVSSNITREAAISEIKELQKEITQFNKDYTKHTGTSFPEVEQWNVKTNGNIAAFNDHIERVNKIKPDFNQLERDAKTFAELQQQITDLTQWYIEMHEQATQRYTTYQSHLKTIGEAQFLKEAQQRIIHVDGSEHTLASYKQQRFSEATREHDTNVYTKTMTLSTAPTALNEIKEKLEQLKTKVDVSKLNANKVVNIYNTWISATEKLGEQITWEQKRIDYAIDLNANINQIALERFEQGYANTDSVVGVWQKFKTDSKERTNNFITFVDKQRTQLPNETSAQWDTKLNLVETEKKKELTYKFTFAENFTRGELDDKLQVKNLAEQPKQSALGRAYLWQQVLAGIATYQFDVTDPNYTRTLRVTADAHLDLPTAVKAEFENFADYRKTDQKQGLNIRFLAAGESDIRPKQDTLSIFIHAISGDLKNIAEQQLWPALQQHLQQLVEAWQAYAKTSAGTSEQAKTVEFMLHKWQAHKFEVATDSDFDNLCHEFERDYQNAINYSISQNSTDHASKQLINATREQAVGTVSTPPTQGEALNVLVYNLKNLITKAPANVQSDLTSNFKNLEIALGTINDHVQQLKNLKAQCDFTIDERKKDNSDLQDILSKEFPKFAQYQTYAIRSHHGNDQVDVRVWDPQTDIYSTIHLNNNNNAWHEVSVVGFNTQFKDKEKTLTAINIKSPDDLEPALKQVNDLLSAFAEYKNKVLKTAIVYENNQADSIARKAALSELEGSIKKADGLLNPPIGTMPLSARVDSRVTRIKKILEGVKVSVETDFNTIEQAYLNFEKQCQDKKIELTQQARDLENQQIGAEVDDIKVEMEAWQEYIEAAKQDTKNLEQSTKNIAYKETPILTKDEYEQKIKELEAEIENKKNQAKIKQFKVKFRDKSPFGRDKNTSEGPDLERGKAIEALEARKEKLDQLKNRLTNQLTEQLKASSDVVLDADTIKATIDNDPKIKEINALLRKIKGDLSKATGNAQAAESGKFDAPVEETESYSEQIQKDIAHLESLKLANLFKRLVFYKPKKDKNLPAGTDANAPQKAPKSVEQLFDPRKKGNAQPEKTTAHNTKSEKAKIYAEITTTFFHTHPEIAHLQFAVEEIADRSTLDSLQGHGIQGETAAGDSYSIKLKKHLSSAGSESPNYVLAVALIHEPIDRETKEQAKTRRIESLVEVFLTIIVPNCNHVTVLEGDDIAALMAIILLADKLDKELTNADEKINIEISPAIKQRYFDTDDSGKLMPKVEYMDDYEFATTYIDNLELNIDELRRDPDSWFSKATARTKDDNNSNESISNSVSPVISH